MCFKKFCGGGSPRFDSAKPNETWAFAEFPTSSPFLNMYWYSTANEEVGPPAASVQPEGSSPDPKESQQSKEAELRAARAVKK